jgi:hypothetical protein
MLPNSIVYNSRTEKIWAESTGKDRKAQIAGYLLDGVYYQSYDESHLIRNAGLGIVNAKGMDLGIYRQLQAPRRIATNRWQIIETHTQKALYIPFKSIGVLIEGNIAKQANIGYGEQIFVPLDRFSEVGKPPLDLPAIQKAFI